MPSTPKPNNPAARKPPAGSVMRRAADTAQQQLAGQAVAPADPTRVVVNGTDYGYLPASYGPAQDPFNQRGGAPETLPIPTGWQQPVEDLNQLPNWDKLSGLEKFVVGLMPGQTGDLAAAYKRWDTDLGGLPSVILSPFKWGGSILAQPAVAGVLGALDVGAEFSERSFGLLRQYIEASTDPAQSAEFTRNFKAAWYAGTLAADSANVTVEIGPDGVSVPNELGGVAVLVKSRQRIAELVSQGATYHDAAIMARDEYLASLGALAIRAQTQDLAWHIVVDPLNIVLGAVKPIEYTRSLRGILLGLSATPAETAKLVENANAARKALEAAQGLGDIAKISDAEKGLTAAEAALTAAQRTAMSPFDQKVTALFGLGDEQRGARNIIRLTGGGPGLEAPIARQVGEAVGKRDWAALAAKLNPFALTPMARAQEFLHLAQDFFGTHLLAGNRLADGSYDVDAIVRGMQRFIDGVSDPALGNMVLSVEGRTVRAATQGFSATLNDLYAARQASKKLEEPLLLLIADALGDGPHQIVKRLNGGEVAAVLAQLKEKLAAQPEKQAALLQLLQANNLAELKPDVLARLSNVLGNKDGKFAGYTDDLFLAELQGKLFDHVERQAIAQFGLKTRGIIRQVADVMKSAESLIYLRVNPGYPVRNWINNNITLIARGAYGTRLDTSAEAFLKRNGFLPPRFGEGYGVEGAVTAVKETGGKTAVAGQLLREAEQGEGKLATLSDKIRDIKMPEPVDMSAQASKFEKGASGRAMTVGYERHFPQVYGRLIDNAANTVRDRLAGVAPDTLDDIKRAIKSARFEADLDGLKDAANLKLTTEGLLARAQKATGLDLSQVLDWGEVRPLLDEVVDLARAGDAAGANAKLAEAAEGVQTHIDDLLDGALEAARDEAAARVAAEGPGAFVKVWSDGMDEFWMGHERHMQNIEEALDLIRKGNRDEAFGLWADTNEKAAAYWQRQWDRFENRITGFAGKANELQLPGVTDIQLSFKNWRQGWDGFFTQRRNLWDEYWTAVRDGKTPPRRAEDIKTMLGDGYKRMVDNELRYQRAIDQRTAAMLPEGQRPLFLAWRERLNAYRTADKEAVIAFRQAIEGMRPEQMEAAWRGHWSERVKAWNQVRQEEQAGLAAMLGYKPAQDHFGQSVARLQADEQVLDALRERVMAGDPLSIDEATELSRLLDRYATPEEAARLRELDAADMADTLNPPRVPTPEGAAMLDADIRKAAAADTNSLLADNLDSPTIKRLFGRTSTPEQPQAKMVWVKQDGDRLVWSETHPGAGAQIKWNGDTTKWHRQPGNEVDGWVEKVYEDLDGDLSDGKSATEMWDEIVNAYRQRKSVNAGARADTGTGDIPTTVDTTGIEFRTAERAAERNVLQAEISQRIADARTAQDPLASWLKTQPPGMEDVMRTNAKDAVRDGEYGIFVDPAGLTARDTAKAEAYRKILSDMGYDWKPEFLPKSGSYRGPITKRVDGVPAQPGSLPAIPDVESIIKPELFVGTGLDQHWYMRGGDGLRSIKNALRDTLNEPPTKWGDLDDAQQAAARELIEQSKGALKDARWHATRMAEFTRDSALLNYNRRFNYNTWLSTIVPFEFWATQSAWKWALHSIDRPAMLAAYLRTKKFLETAYRPEQGLPSRLRGSIRVHIPFMPDWMGNEVFIDPLRLALPFDNWAAPLEQMNQQDVRDVGTARRKLEELLNDGQIAADEYQDALDSQSGPVWERALALARQDDAEGRMNGMDVATALFPPHLPILYAMDAARNRNPFEERGPILPTTRSLGKILATLGADPAGVLNPEAALRKQLGLHPFSKWDDYLAERMLSNMVGGGELDVAEAQRAMIEHTGPAWEEAVRRAGIERGGGNIVTALMGLAGIPSSPYPPGEEAQRKLQDDYAAAWQRYDESGGDYKATVGAWLEQNPGYEARLALFDTPEERLHQFLQDEFWDRWNTLPKLTKDQIRDQLGPQFESAMLDPNTGYGKNADPGQLAAWLKLMGANPPGSLQAAAGGQALELAPPEVAQRAQVFYDTRTAQYPGWYEAQQGYFDLGDQLERQYGVEAALVELERAGDDAKARARVMRANPALGQFFDARKAATDSYLDSQPVLRAYWQWRDSFLARNTDVAPYLDDDPVYAERAPQNFQPEPNFSWDEWRQIVGFEVSALVLDYTDYGDDMPAVARDRLEAEMARLGWDGDWRSFAQHIADSRVPQAVP